MIPATLAKALRDPDTPLPVILRVRAITKLIPLRNPDYETYFISKSTQLLQFTFSDERTSLALTAFKILSADDCQFLQPVVANGSFSNQVVELLSQPAPPAAWVTGRIATLTLLALQNAREATFHACGFIFRLLPYCDNPAVYTFFETITSEDPDVPLPAVHRWLRDFGLCEYLIRQIRDLDFWYKSALANPYKDPVYNRAVDLYQLISRGCENSILKSEFQKSDVVECLAQQFATMPDFVQIARWKAIVAVTCDVTAQLAVAFYTQAVALLQESFESLREYRVSALQFLTKMLELEEHGFEIVLQTRVMQNILNLIFQFHNSTLLHNEFLRFVRVGMRNPAFAEAILMFYVPVAVDRGVRDENRIVRSACLELVGMVIEAGKKNKAVRMMVRESSDVVEFENGPLKQFKKAMAAGYGGKVPSGM